MIELKFTLAKVRKHYNFKEDKGEIKTIFCIFTSKLNNMTESNNYTFEKDGLIFESNIEPKLWEDLFNFTSNVRLLQEDDKKEVIKIVQPSTNNYLRISKHL